MLDRTVAAIVLCGLVVLGGCGGDDTPRAVRQPTPLDESTTGSITVDVGVDGTVPPMEQLRMSGFAECTAQHPDGVAVGDKLVANGKVQNAFVYIKDGLGDRVFAVPTERIVIDQLGCLYVPRVAGAQVDQPIEFKNSDDTLHNVHGAPKLSSPWNVALPRKGTERTIAVTRPEVMISVRCDLHPWMQGWLGVLDHPYFGVSGADGRVVLKNVPPGDYTIGVWHERFGTREQKVTLPAKGTESLTVTLAVP
ncbi:MAG TPA: carboxypeptidase regulatory-like domain-containing protein [Candidatus Binatia bacterium]|jgi:hypothetical protein|nr:carboxypeptidase regulatory-like domain-containing protein [Candidatus Binatia bacterium]